MPLSSLLMIWCESAAASMSMMLSRISRPVTNPLCLQSTEVSAAIARGRVNSSVMSFESLLFRLSGRSAEGDRTKAMGSVGRLPFGMKTMSDSRKSAGSVLPSKMQ
eukprot:10946859-Heterocapsa_arctica.AAC.1